ncbi:alpha/beta hydrolase [Calidifontibacter sp. DB0510]|uniref:Alpha/beta hydrolase n=2 Tax=Metallococcus carri TaxID=1656884 RepID=A0A967AZM5_9MICO|nr:alpha/beta hydrolase [Metallococcus carri]
MIHGGPGLWSDFEDLVALLSEGSVVHTYDQRGCGRSDPSDEQSMQHSVADLEALREHWGHDRWVVVGHSAGASIALAYAAQHPERTAAVGYLDGTGIGDWRSAHRAERARRLGDLAARLEQLDGIPDRSWEQEVEWRDLQWLPDDADPVAGRERRRHLAATDLAINLVANRQIRASDADLIAWAAATTCPVFFIHGSADPRPVPNVLALAAKTAHARKRVVEGGGHSPWVEQPGQTAELLHEVVQAGR